MNPLEIKIEDYTYVLPEDRIAKYPLEQRDNSKLLVYKDYNISHESFRDISHQLPKETTLIFNDSKVLPVRLRFTHSTGAEIEIFCLEQIKSESSLDYESWKCFVGKAGKWKDPTLTNSKNNAELNAVLLRKEEDYFVVKFTWSSTIENMVDALQIFGQIPIPPYLNRPSEEIDTIRYQNVFAQEKGSVAAPTAGLHFTSKILSELKQAKMSIDFVTLHVGAGTFKPVKSKTIGEHLMHMEQVVVSLSFIENLIDKLTSKKSITAVGTTSVRTLESLFWLGCRLVQTPNLNEEQLHIQQWEPYQENKTAQPAEALRAIKNWLEQNQKSLLRFSTEIMIVPSYKFNMVDCIITNFHQPNSTLLLLIAAAVGHSWKTIYEEALKNGYRFLSYGDASLLYVSS